MQPGETPVADDHKGNATINKRARKRDMDASSIRNLLGINKGENPSGKLDGWLHAVMVYTPLDGHPSKY